MMVSKAIPVGTAAYDKNWTSVLDISIELSRALRGLLLDANYKA